MKNEEIVRALRCCAEPGRECEEDCPMNEISREPCREVLAPAAADLIEKLTDRCARYAEEIAVAQERAQWIPVTKRLPEATDGDYVLACVTWKDTRIDYQNAVVMAFVSEDGLVDVEMDCVLDGVTHWMRMPAPPEVE